jgi:hypothetical protein
MAQSVKKPTAGCYTCGDPTHFAKNCPTGIPPADAWKKALREDRRQKPYDNHGNKNL